MKRAFHKNEKIFIKEPLKIVALYASFGLLWILFSDKVLSEIVPDMGLYTTLQTYKGFLFIVSTAVLLFFLIKDSHYKIMKLNKNLQNSIIESQNNQNLFKKTQSELYNLNNSISSFFNLSLKMLGPSKYQDELFIKEIFKIVFEISTESDFGSAFFIKNQKIHFIDSIGLDLDKLNGMTLDLSQYNLSSQEIIIDKNYIKEKNLNNKLLQQGKEFVHVGISKNGELFGGFCLGIKKESDKSYRKKTIHKIKTFQQLSNGFYKIKKDSDYKMALQKDVVQSFITALEFHDIYTKGHSESVALHSFKIGKAMGLNNNEIEDLYWASTMHDIGKIIVPSNILNKEGKLTDSEYEVIKKHPEIGYKIISQSNTLKNISKYILYHHERWDGKGYPKGLKNEEIPLLSQIISVADSWHAMTSERSYKKQLKKDEAIEELLRNRGTQFSPKIVDIFVDILKNN